MNIRMIWIEETEQKNMFGEPTIILTANIRRPAAQEFEKELNAEAEKQLKAQRGNRKGKFETHIRWIKG